MPFESIAVEAGTEPCIGSARVREERWLLGQPPLSHYLDFVRRSVVGGSDLDPRALCDEWRAANDVYHELEADEAGLPDTARCRKLPKPMRPLADALAEQPHFRNTFDALPVSFGLVELDKLVVSQPHVTLPFVEALKARLDPAPDEAGLFRFCQPTERRDPPVSARRIDSRRFVFACDSTDFRYHETALLGAGQLAGYQSFGPVAGAVGVVVGFGSNMLAVIRSDRRMLLHNGYHRACALRAAGYRFAPAVIQTVTRRDELQLIASRTVQEEPAFFFASKRPPLLKDFFDPRISKVLPVNTMEKLIEVTVDVREIDLRKG